jgi:hypothetical protein
MTRGAHALLTAFVLAAALLGTPAAAHALTVGACTITPMKPERVSSTGARASAALSCAPAPPPGLRAVQVEFTLYGDDPVGDDRLGTLTHGANVPPAQRIRTNRNIRCDEDPIGADELYAKVRARVQEAGAPFSAWSRPQRTSTVRMDCD